MMTIIVIILARAWTGEYLMFWLNNEYPLIDIVFQIVDYSRRV